MLIRISLIVAIIAGLAVGVLNFITVKNKITDLQTRLANETDAKEKAQRELASTKKTLKQTQEALDATNQVLQATIIERDKAVAEAATQSKRATQLADDLKKT